MGLPGGRRRHMGSGRAGTSPVDVPSHGVCTRWLDAADGQRRRSSSEDGPNTPPVSLGRRPAPSSSAPSGWWDRFAPGLPYRRCRGRHPKVRDERGTCSSQPGQSSRRGVAVSDAGTCRSSDGQAKLACTAVLDAAHRNQHEAEVVDLRKQPTRCRLVRERTRDHRHVLALVPDGEAVEPGRPALPRGFLRLGSRSASRLRRPVLGRPRRQGRLQRQGSCFGRCPSRSSIGPARAFGRRRIHHDLTTELSACGRSFARGSENPLGLQPPSGRPAIRSSVVDVDVAHFVSSIPRQQPQVLEDATKRGRRRHHLKVDASGGNGAVVRSGHQAEFAGSGGRLGAVRRT
jgi:hypothetical protein